MKLNTTQQLYEPEKSLVSVLTERLFIRNINKRS
jgi:hypothetical protein